ncbi:MAG: YcxB family protein [Ginsengibacter sp.]
MRSALFTYDKKKVIQALRFHFISRREIKLMIIFVNVFAIASAAFYFFGYVTPVAFLLASGLWFILMISFWFVLPLTIYKKAATFKDSFVVRLEPHHMFLENAKGSRSWPWKSFSTFVESPHFFHLYFDSRSFFLIPKEAFQDNDTFEVRAFLKEHIIKK